MPESKPSSEHLKTLAYLALIDTLQKAAESSDILSDEPNDKYAKCTEHILKAIAALVRPYGT